MSTTTLFDGLFHSKLQAASGRLFWFGLAMTVLGVFALVFPVISTLAATVFVGWMLLISGGFALAGAFSVRGTGPFFGALLHALLSIAAGVFLLLSPLSGAVALTLPLGAIVMIEGAFQMVMAFEMRPAQGWTALLISSIASIVLALLIIAGWPAISLVVLGVLLGVNFVSTGLAYIFVSRTLKPAA